MNIDVYINNSIESRNNINSPFKYNYMDEVNPSSDLIGEILINDESLTGVCYITEYNVDKTLLSTTDIFINQDNSVYIICNFNKNMSDIITGVMCDYNISLLYNNNEINLPKNDFPHMNTITFPILCMIYGMIRFKIHFKNRDDFNSATIKIKYISVTLSNKSLVNFNNMLKFTKYIYNNMAITFKDGLIDNKYNLD